MIHALSIAVQIWLCGIPVAFLVLGVIYSQVHPLVRVALRSSSYVLWCVAWPWALGIIALNTARAWWQR